MLAAPCLVRAQQPSTLPSGTPVATQPSSIETVQLNFPSSIEIKALIDYVSARLNINILYDEADGKKRVTLVSPASIPKGSLLGLLQGVLKMADLALVDGDQPGWKRIVPAKDLLAISSGIATERGTSNSTDATSVVSQIFVVKNAATAAVEQAIKPFLSKPGGNSFSIADRGLIIITDYAVNTQRVAALIDLLDQPSAPANIQFVEVHNLDAESLARQVTALLADQDRLGAPEARAKGARVVLSPVPRQNMIAVISASGANDAITLIQKLDVQENFVTQSYHLRHVAPQRIDKLAKELVGSSQLKDIYRSSIDAESGLLIVTAPQAVQERIAQLQQELDVATTDPAMSHIRFYKLMNTTVDKVLATIRSMEGVDKGLPKAQMEQQPVPGDMPPSGQNAPPAGPGQPLPLPPFARESSSQPAETVAQSAAEQSLTAKTENATITADPNTNTLIIMAPPAMQKVYQELITTLDKRRPQVMVEVTLVTIDNTKSLAFGMELSKIKIGGDTSYAVFSSFGLSDVDPATGSVALNPGTGLNGILLSSDCVNAVLRAAATSAYAKVLSAPKVLVNDNAAATLASVAESPFTSVNASETVATTSFAGYASAGTTISVTPHISEGDHLQLVYTVTLNSFTGKASNGVPPPRQTNTVNSEVTIPDGYTVVVGGLSRQDNSHTENKIPLLGDIPLVKYLFSSHDWQDSNNTLYVFIRPVILRDDRFEDLKYLSERDLGTAGLPSNLPCVQPLWIN